LAGSFVNEDNVMPMDSPLLPLPTPLLLLAQATPEWMRSPWVVVCAILGAALVALFLRVQSLASEVEELRSRVVPSPSSAGSSAPAGDAVPAGPLVEPVKAAGDLPDGHLVAIVTAAAVAALGRPVVVRRLTFLNQNTVSGWAEAGRLMIQTSHNMQRKV
jgi:hypothetical protein